MTIPTSTQPTNPSTSTNGSEAVQTHEKVFVGETRTIALKHLTSAIVDRRQSVVIQLIKKDPSLAFEMVSMPLRPLSEMTIPVEFPLACLRSGMAAGYVAAIGFGFDVDSLLQDRSTNLLQAALTSPGSPSSHEANVSLLLSMGADPAAMPSADVIYSVVAGSFPPNGGDINMGVMSMLIDAKADFSYQKSLVCPFSAMVNMNASAWTFDETATQMTRMMSRMVASGVDINRSTGSPSQTPIARALGKRNSVAMKALIRLGAKTDASVLGGKDIFDLMDKSGMTAMKPEVQSLMMEAQINQATCEAVKSEVASSSPAAPSARRRVGLI